MPDKFRRLIGPNNSDTASQNFKDIDCNLISIRQTFKNNLMQLSPVNPFNLSSTIDELSELMKQTSDEVIVQIDLMGDTSASFQLLIERTNFMIREELNQIEEKILVKAKDAIVELFSKRLTKIPPDSFAEISKKLMFQLLKRYEQTVLIAKRGK